MGKNINHIGVFTSGGDSPGMNAALYAIAKAAEINGIQVSGIQKGYEGMIDGNFIPMEPQQLQKTVHRGGTILKTSRSARFLTIEGRLMAMEMLQKNSI
ncbi:MAG TPA: 6-phosphofructokinase, partial [Daejeonella sp.]|nr:6-phosphofructokinase [Daejeonella sp.]